MQKLIDVSKNKNEVAEGAIERLNLFHTHPQKQLCNFGLKYMLDNKRNNDLNNAVEVFKSSQASARENGAGSLTAGVLLGLTGIFTWKTGRFAPRS